VSEKRFRLGRPEFSRNVGGSARLREKQSPLRTANTTALHAYRANFARAESTNAGAQEASVILYAHLAARQKVCDRCHRFFAASRAGTDCQDQIAERQPSAGSHDLAKLTISFHMLAIFGLSRSNAMIHCEYVFHRNR
jgi:hypothetical protein